MLDQLNRSMDLSFMNQNLEGKFMVGLADLEVLDKNFYITDNVDQNKNNNNKKEVEPDES